MHCVKSHTSDNISPCYYLLPHSQLVHLVCFYITPVTLFFRENCLYWIIINTPISSNENIKSISGSFSPFFVFTVRRTQKTYHTSSVAGRARHPCVPSSPRETVTTSCACVASPMRPCMVIN